MNTYAYQHDIRLRSPYLNYPFEGTPAAVLVRWSVAGVDFAGRAIGRIRDRVAAARRQREAEALLLGMSDRDLRDIGLTRDQLYRHYHDGRI